MTIITQGRFTSTGNAQIIDVPSGVDWIKVINQTQMATQQATGRGVQFEWYKGMAQGSAFETKKTNSTDALNGVYISTGGFTVVDPNATYAPVTGTTITKANPAVCTAANHGYSNGDIVVISNNAVMTQLGGNYFTVGGVTTNTFTLAYFNTNTANFTAETGFEVTKLSPSQWKQNLNTISAITTGTTTQVQVTVSAPDNYVFPVGQIIKFAVPAVFGMSQINGMSGEVLSYNSSTNTYTVDIDSSAFSAFAWPAASAYPFSTPLIYNAGSLATTSDGATSNVGLLQISLAAGAQSPAGSASDVIYWVAGKSALVDLE